MNTHFTFNGIDYEIVTHINKKGEETNFNQVQRVDGGSLNQVDVCRRFLASKGYNGNSLQAPYYAADYVYKVINNIPIDLPRLDVRG